MSTSFSTYQSGRGPTAIASAGDRLFSRLSEALNQQDELEDDGFREQTHRNELPMEYRAAHEEALTSEHSDPRGP